MTGVTEFLTNLEGRKREDDQDKQTSTPHWHPHLNAVKQAINVLRTPEQIDLANTETHQLIKAVSVACKESTFNIRQRYQYRVKHWLLLLLSSFSSPVKRFKTSVPQHCLFQTVDQGWKCPKFQLSWCDYKK
ncbi:hypothetical protein RvY_05724 [Ramazzottius varieornatus]|uniref:Uncharacterized protein n=1 Tax=Ramazzottius varieornatus TaxID=947166 RepID=A0A1D1V510_RAMVA|nr:hypothetical protein RvY_05724 [Ramazzottius varieornatus]